MNRRVEKGKERNEVEKREREHWEEKEEHQK